METLAEQPPQTETLDRYLRKYNDTTTWLAEALDGSMRTPFEYRFDGVELYADDGGALGTVFEDAIVHAEAMRAADPSLAFELRRRRLEQGEYQDMLAMMRGQAPNTMVVVSDFPPELMTATEDVGGYNVMRKPTMLRVIGRQGDRLHMYSQTLDGSDRAGLEAIYARFGYTAQPGELLGQRLQLDVPPADQPGIIDQAMAAYDASLARRHGGHWQAGRPELAADTYAFVQSQHTLIDHFVMRSLTSGTSEHDLYNLAALMTQRFEDHKQQSFSVVVEAKQMITNYIWHDIEHELHRVGDKARAAGKTFTGCGLSANGGHSADGRLREAGYGNQADDDEDDEYGSLTFYCKNKHWNRRPRHQLISQCRIRSCRDSVAC